VAFNHNGGDEKLKAGKAARGRSAKKKAAGGKTSSGTQDVAKNPAMEAPARKARKSAVKPIASDTRSKSKGGPSAQAKHGLAGGPGCGGCSAGCMIEDPIEVAKRTMQGSVPAIVEAMVKKAKQGSCPHAKTLLEMTGAKFMFGDGPEMREAGEPWAKLVLERMERAEREKAERTPGQRGE